MALPRPNRSPARGPALALPGALPAGTLCCALALLGALPAAASGAASGAGPRPPVAVSPSMVQFAAATDAAERETIHRADPVIDALKRQGYVIVSIDTTWLNRVRIRAQNGHILREIVVSPSSGDILRDAVVRQLGPTGTTRPEDQTFVPLDPPRP